MEHRESSGTLARIYPYTSKRKTGERNPKPQMQWEGRLEILLIYTMNNSCQISGRQDSKSEPGMKHLDQFLDILVDLCFV